MRGTALLRKARKAPKARTTWPRRWTPPEGSPNPDLTLSALATMPNVSPRAGELAAELGTTAEALGPVLDFLERKGRIERWSEGPRSAPSATRVMLSARSVALLGLALSPKGDRWQTRGERDDKTTMCLRAAANVLWPMSTDI